MVEERIQRRLAAILAADVAGYSRLMEQDEVGTLAALKDRRKSVLQPLLALHHGRIVKQMGDGVLVEFASAVNAVQFAVDLQKGMSVANGDLPDDRRIVLRIGVNLGDVIVEGNDLYGDGVNVAARLQAMADPGGVLIAGAIYDQIKNNLKLACDDLGTQTVRNLAQPVRIYRISIEGFAAETASATTLPLPSRPSIAILPFTNMSGDPDQQYFSDGITEDIITDLSHFHSLFVIARNSSFQYRDRAIDVKRVGRELGVQYVVEGSVRRAGSRVRINAQLIDAKTGNHLWAQRYDRSMEDIFAVQEEVAQSVAATVSGRVEAAGRDQAFRLSPSALQAYDLVLRAKALMLTYTRINIEQSRICAENAVQLDPGNARAYAHLAWCEWLVFTACWTEDREKALGKAYELARRAVGLDESDSFTRWMLGVVHLFRREYDKARLELEKAIEMNPNDPEARGIYGLFLSAVGEAERGIEQFDIAKRHNPFDYSWMPWVKGIAYFTAHRYEEAIAVLKEVRDPINEVRGWLVASYAHAGHLAEAKSMLEEFLRVAEHDMAVFPGRRLSDWESYWHCAIEYRDKEDFDHLFAALRKAGLPD
jgi:adenylate cyclase